MIRGPLSDSAFKGQFSGHETFPLRHLWLRKAFDAVSANSRSKGVFGDEDGIVRFGVGKNMVSAIRHWALACEVIAETPSGYEPAAIGEYLFGADGRDPYMESPATTWLVHWLVAGRPERTTTWFWAFNHFSIQQFTRDQLAQSILDFCRERKRSRTSAATIKADVQCFIRSYVARDEGRFTDDSMEPVLSELGLLRPLGSNAFEFRRGPKPTLPDGVFNYALCDFWSRFAPSQATLAVENIAYEPGSPGRVFRLDEHSLIERLARIDQSSSGAFVWSDTAGVRNVSRRRALVSSEQLLDAAYISASAVRAA